MADYTLYWCAQTRASRIVWLLEEAGVQYDLHPIDIRDEAARSDPAFRAASPMGKVPALRHGDATVFESAAIALYVAEQAPESGLAPPPGDPARAEYFEWMVFTPAYIEPAMSEKFSGAEPNRATNGWGDFDSVIETLDTRLTGRTWILGEAFTAADILVGSSLHFMRMFGILPDRPALAAYVDRCTARPAFGAAMAKDTA